VLLSTAVFDIKDLTPCPVALKVPGDMLLFDEDERQPPEDFAMQFEAISKFSPEEKKTIKEVLEGLILKHEAKKWSATL
jgi:hypothetical protein